jgi:hypothetical protein
MPFSSTASCSGERWTEIYETIFRPAVEAAGYTCDRAMPVTGSLIRSILERLRHASIVIADITDRNSNVFYELGVRHCLSKRTVVLTQGDEHVPSDLRGYWWLTYGTGPAQVVQFQKDILRVFADIERDPDRSDSPISDYLEHENLAISAVVQRENVKKLTALLTELSANGLAVEKLMEDPEAPVFVAHDCLGLLLQTLYIDVGPSLLKVAYELLWKLRAVGVLGHDRPLLHDALHEIQFLTVQLSEIHRKLQLGQYQEPDQVSIMVWYPPGKDRGEGVSGIAAPTPAPQPMPRRPEPAPPPTPLHPNQPHEACPACGRKTPGPPGRRYCMVCDRTF